MQNRAGFWRACITFFDLILIHDSLESYYRMNMKLVTEFQLDLASVEDMMPFEREIYLNLLNDHIKNEQDQLPQ